MRAFSTSGDYERYFEQDGVRYHHIIDPRTGKSPHAVRSVTVIASTALRTDGLTKTVFILGPQKGIEFINGLTDARCGADHRRRAQGLFERPGTALKRRRRSLPIRTRSR